MSKKVWVGFIVVFIVMMILDGIVNGLLMKSDYEATKSMWRVDMKMWLFYVVDLFIAFFFTLIFSKGYEGKGIGEGVRYGFYVGMLMSVPMAYGTYAAMEIPYSMALQWFVYGLIMYIILGMVVATVFGKVGAGMPAAQMKEHTST
jgi:hypothetical protein